MKLSDLQQDTRNANKGTAKGQKAIVNSVQRSKLGRSIVVDKHNRIIAGNKTSEAVAEALGIDAELLIVETTGDKLIVHKRTDLDLDDPDPNNPARQLAYADNLTGWASFELDPSVVMADIEAGFDFEAIDISLPDLGELLGNAADELLNGGNQGEDTEPQIDKAEELRVKWGVEPGQMWQLGDHRIVCGDCTDAAVVAMVMGGEKATMCFTDPPWNVAIGKDSNPPHRQREGLQNDDMSPAEFSEFLGGFIKLLEKYVTGDLYCVLGASEWPTLDLVLRNNGWHWSATIIWVKDLFVFGRSKYHRRYEPIWYGWHTKKRSSFGAARDLDDVWEIPRPRSSEEHPTMKPVELVVRAVTNSSATGDFIYEPFSGSGTTIIACENLGRRCRAIEIDAGYVAVALQRWADHTGKTPELIAEN